MSATLNPEIAALRDKVEGYGKELAENAWYCQSTQ